MSAPLVAAMQAARLSLERERKARATCSPAALQAHFAADSEKGQGCTRIAINPKKILDNDPMIKILLKVTQKIHLIMLAKMCYRPV